ncbi:unnamed protein product [Hapterophycus canaliculatus]
MCIFVSLFAVLYPSAHFVRVTSSATCFPSVFRQTGAEGEQARYEGRPVLMLTRSAFFVFSCFELFLYSLFRQLILMRGLGHFSANVSWRSCRNERIAALSPSLLCGERHAQVPLKVPRELPLKTMRTRPFRGVRAPRTPQEAKGRGWDANVASGQYAASCTAVCFCSGKEGRLTKGGRWQGNRRTEAGER